MLFMVFINLIFNNQHYEFGIILMGMSVVSYHTLVSTHGINFWLYFVVANDIILETLLLIVH
jgi:hypothetical protein